MYIAGMAKDIDFNEKHYLGHSTSELKKAATEIDEVYARICKSLDQESLALPLPKTKKTSGEVIVVTFEIPTMLTVAKDKIDSGQAELLESKIEKCEGQVYRARLAVVN